MPHNLCKKGEIWYPSCFMCSSGLDLRIMPLVSFLTSRRQGNTALLERVGAEKAGKKSFSLQGLNHAAHLWCDASGFMVRRKNVHRFHQVLITRR